MWLDVNGERMQTGSTKTMIFNVAQIVSYVLPLHDPGAGDVITTGTPPGVGMGMKPQRFLKAGDVVTLGIEGLGEQRQTFVRLRGQRPRHDPGPRPRGALSRPARMKKPRGAAAGSLPAARRVTNAPGSPAAAGR